MAITYYPGAIFRVTIVWGNYQWSIILWDNSLGDSCPWANYLGLIIWGKLPGGFFERQLS